METSHVCYSFPWSDFWKDSVRLAVRLCDAILPSMVGKAPCRIHKRGMYEQGTSSESVNMGVADTGHTSSPHGLSLRRVLKGKEENPRGVSRER